MLPCTQIIIAIVRLCLWTRFPRQALSSVVAILFTLSGLAGSAAGLEGLTVGGFADLTVVQRRDGAGTIACAGLAPAGVLDLEVQVVTDDGLSVVRPWTHVATASDGAWKGAIAAPQGGWYRLAIRPVDSLAVPSLSARWGIGAVVACLGQSNMVNVFAVSAGAATSDGLTRLHGYRGANGNGPGPVVGNGAIRLANHLRTQLGVPVLLLDYAVPGVSLTSWTTPSDPTWTTFTRGLADAGGDCELILWHQGANDALAGVTESAYRQGLDTLFTRINALVPARASLPFVCAIQNRGDYQPKSSSTDRGYDQIRCAQWDWARTTPGAVPGGTTIDMVLVDTGHWAAPDYELFADRLAQSTLHAMRPAAFPHHSGGASLTSATRSGAHVVVTVRHDAGNSLRGAKAATGLEGFVVDTGDGSAVLPLSGASIAGPDRVALTLAADPGSAAVRVRYLVGMNPFGDRAVGNLLYDDAAYLGGRIGLPVNAEQHGLVATLSPDASTVRPLATIRVDLGGTRTAAAPWNNLVWPARSLDRLRNDADVVTSVGLAVTEPFLGCNSLGVDANCGDLPAAALADTYFGGTDFMGQSCTRAALTITGLDPASIYTLSLGGSRSGVADNRETRYTISGAGAPVVRLLQISNNVGTLANASGLRPAADGSLLIQVDKGPANTSSNGFFYLGVLMLEQFPVPAPLPAPVPPSPVGPRTICIDLGGARTSAAPWNNLVWPNQALTALRDDTGSPTAIGLAITEPFMHNNTLGVDASTSTVPATALADSYFGGTDFAGQSCTRAAVKLTGLDPATAYAISLGGSRAGVTDNRETRYTLTGAGAPVVRLLQAANNLGTLASISDLRPTADGCVIIQVDKGPANTSANGFYYLGVIIVQVQAASAPPVVVAPPVTVERTVAIDLGGARTSAAPWNNLVWPSQALSALRDNAGVATSINLRVTEPFLNCNSLGVDAGTATVPADALVDGYFGGLDFQGQSSTRSAITLSGLDPRAVYTLTMGASRSGVPDNRETSYTVTGSGAPVVRLLSVTNNVGTLAVAEGLYPAADGTLTLFIAPGPANTSPNRFYHLGVLLLKEVRTAASGSG